MPDAGHLAKLRASIDERPRRWRRVLSEEAFRRVFLPGAKRGDEEGCVKEFAKRNKENALKKKPKVSGSVVHASPVTGWVAMHPTRQSIASSRGNRGLHVSGSGLEGFLVIAA